MILKVNIYEFVLKQNCRVSCYRLSHPQLFFSDQLHNSLVIWVLIRQPHVLKWHNGDGVLSFHTRLPAGDDTVLSWMVLAAAELLPCQEEREAAAASQTDASTDTT